MSAAGRTGEVLAKMQQAALIGDVDSALARLLVRLESSAEPARGEILAVATALVSAAANRGEVGVDLSTLAAETRRWLDNDGDVVEVLRTASCCGDGLAPTPLVLDRNRVYLYRHFDDECRLAAQLLARNRDADLPPGMVEPLAAQLAALFPRGEEVDWQQVAAAHALLRHLSVVSGGPGTGKTTTLVRLLALALHALGADLRIGLAAPTGKAAARMQQAISDALPTLALPEALRAALSVPAMTVHRLLGARGRGGGFRHHAGNPLAVDLLVVDEVSMVDQAMMVRLLEALPADARVVLLGDRDQLASVDPGSVFADLGRNAGCFGEELASRLGAVTGRSLAASPEPATGLADAAVLLTRSYRFGADSGIGRLAGAIVSGDAEAALACLDDAAFADVGRVDDGGATEPEALASWLDDIVERVREAARGGSPSSLFPRQRRCQLLCALRHGPRGVAGLNARVEQHLARHGLRPAEAEWYPGRPVMVTRNDAAQNLFNGDIGLVLRHPDSGELRVCFEQAEGVRWLHPARLPEHETAWAMTVHKAQGSEFDQVVLVLPREDTPVLTREWLYTGVSRARQQVLLHGEASVLAAAIGRRVQREGALSERLAPTPVDEAG